MWYIKYGNSDLWMENLISEEVAMIGPTANPVMIVLITTIFFVGLGYISYFFGREDSHSHS